MGYTKIVQYGEFTEIYEYEKPRPDTKPRALSAIQKKRQRERQKLSRSLPRSQKSINRSRGAFFRLVHHNNHLADTIHFLTLTFAYDITYKKANRAVSDFFSRLHKRYPETISVSYISVPEKTKNGRFHFHLLLYNLSPEISQRERETRNLQRLFRRGYLDISPALTVTEGLAGYMAKYMAKALGDIDNGSIRGYTCSRNIEKIYSGGSNSLGGYTDLIISDGSLAKEQKMYDTMFLGRCSYKKYKK